MLRGCLRACKLLTLFRYRRVNRDRTAWRPPPSLMRLSWVAKCSLPPKFPHVFVPRYSSGYELQPGWKSPKSLGELEGNSRFSSLYGVSNAVTSWRIRYLQIVDRSIWNLSGWIWCRAVSYTWGRVGVPGALAYVLSTRDDIDREAQRPRHLPSGWRHEKNPNW